MLLLVDFLIAGLAFLLGLWAGVKVGPGCLNCTCRICKPSSQPDERLDEDDLSELLRKNWPQ